MAEWILNPDMSAVEGFPSQYWIITGDAVTLMDQAERDAVDAAALSRAGQTAAAWSNRKPIRAVMPLALDELNAMRSRPTPSSMRSMPPPRWPT